MVAMQKVKFMSALIINDLNIFLKLTISVISANRLMSYGCMI